MSRHAEISRKTGETDVSVIVDLDGDGSAGIETGLGLLDHMLTSLARHSRIDITLAARGDLAVDDHHTVEDCAILLGRAVDQALGERVGIRRFGSAHAPLDESLSRAVVDLSGRPWAEIHLEFSRSMIGDVATENIVHFLRSLAMEARLTLHVDSIRGDNDHHQAESAFKAFALAMRQAITVDGDVVPSTKGSLR